MSFFVLDDSTAEAKMPILLTRVDRNLRMPYGSGPHPYSSTQGLSSSARCSSVWGSAEHQMIHVESDYDLKKVHHRWSVRPCSLHNAPLRLRNYRLTAVPG